MVIQVPLILQRTHSCCSITCTKTTWKPSEFLCDKRDFPSESFTVSFWLTRSQRERFHFLSLIFFTILLHYHFPVTFSAVSLLENSSQGEGTLTEEHHCCQHILQRKSKFWSTSYQLRDFIHSAIFMPKRICSLGGVLCSHCPYTWLLNPLWLV